jgi:hypothetical protein
VQVVAVQLPLVTLLHWAMAQTQFYLHLLLLQLLRSVGAWEVIIQDILEDMVDLEVVERDIRRRLLVVPAHLAKDILVELIQRLAVVNLREAVVVVLEVQAHLQQTSEAEILSPVDLVLHLQYLDLM